MNVVHVARDYGGLQCATLELLEEARLEPQRKRNERTAERAGENAEHILAATAPKRTLADGYYARVGYLFELDAMIRRGAGIATMVLDMDESRGLAAVEAARNQFDALHPQCRRCGARLENEWDKTCNECQIAAAAAARRTE
jgi:ribosomal protein L37E